MNINEEKLKIIEKVEKMNDEVLLQAINDLLEFKPPQYNEELEKSLDISLKQSEDGLVIPHHEAMAEIMKRLNK
jgi:hypothetical protein